jgi:hypothetical protein
VFTFQFFNDKIYSYTKKDIGKWQFAEIGVLVNFIIQKFYTYSGPRICLLSSTANPANFLGLGGSFGINLTNFRQANLQLHNRTNNNMLHMYVVDTVFPRIVSSLEYFPPLNSFRNKNLLIINSFLP